jgi:hypothetical protein
VYGTSAPAAVRRVAALAEEHLAGAAPEVVVAVGCDDPGLAGRLPAGPRVIVPASACRRPPPWARALLATADATVLIDPCEVVALGPVLNGPVVLSGVPAPPRSSGPGGLHTGPGGARLLELWRSEVGEPPRGGPGVAWATGPATLAEAGEAWARGAAVVVLPGAPRHVMLRRGGALVARSSLEAIEATRFLLGARPLARELARRGRHQLTLFEPLDLVVTRFAEALALAEAGA